MGEESRAFFGRDFDNWMQAQRLQAQLEDHALPKFSICLNLGDIHPKNVQVSVTDRAVTVSGYQKEIVEDEDGMVRETFHGFSNEFGLPEDADQNTVVVTDNQDQSITIEADYYIPFKAHLEEVPPVVCQRPSSVPPAPSQRDVTLNRTDTSKPPYRSSISSPSINSFPRGFTTDPASYDSSAAFSSNQMQPLQNGTESSAGIISGMSSHYGVSTLFSPSQMNNLQNGMAYSENNRSDMQSQFNFSGPSSQAPQSTTGLPPDSNSAIFSQFPPAAQPSPCQMKALQQSQGSCADSSSCQFSPTAQPSPCQMKALQQSQGSCADNSCGMPYKCTSPLSPCQIKALQNGQQLAVENCYNNGISPSSIHQGLTCPLPHSYTGKPSSNTCNTPNRSPQVNRSLLKPGTRCEECLSSCTPKYDYKVPGTRCPLSTQCPGETTVENRPRSFHNASFMKNVSFPGLISKTW